MKRLVLILTVVLIGCAEEPDCEPEPNELIHNVEIEVSEPKKAFVWTGCIFDYITYRYKQLDIDTKNGVSGCFQCPKCKGSYQGILFHYTAGIGGGTGGCGNTQDDMRILCCSKCRTLLTTDWKLIDRYNLEYDVKKRKAKQKEGYQKEGYRFKELHEAMKDKEELQQQIAPAAID